MDRSVEEGKLLSALEATDAKKRGVYVYGQPGCGKTSFVRDVLERNGYDMVLYDASDVRNKAVIARMSKDSMSKWNVMSMFSRKRKRIAVVMDDVDSMNSGDKGGINELISLLRCKKNKQASYNPIVCIGNMAQDKKITELMNACTTVYLPPPPDAFVEQQLRHKGAFSAETARGVGGNLHRLQTALHARAPATTKERGAGAGAERPGGTVSAIVKQLIYAPHSLASHATVMNEQDRTTIALLWHENVVDYLRSKAKQTAFPLYLRMLETMCVADMVDRTTFQKQIWQFNEMSSLLKTFRNAKLLHDTFPSSAHGQQQGQKAEIRFTKLLTKYASEYNNAGFILHMCQELSLDRKDLLALFLYLRETYGTADAIAEQLDPMCFDKPVTVVKRMLKYLNKYVAPYDITSVSSATSYMASADYIHEHDCPDP